MDTIVKPTTNTAPIIIVPSGVANAAKRLAYYEERRVKKVVRGIISNGKKRNNSVNSIIIKNEQRVENNGDDDGGDDWQAGSDGDDDDANINNNPRRVPELVPDDEFPDDDTQTDMFWKIIESAGWNGGRNIIAQRNFVTKLQKTEYRIYSLKLQEMFMALKVRITPLFNENNIEEYIDMTAAYFIFRGKAAFENAIDDPTIAMFYAQNGMCSDMRDYIL